MEATAPTSPDTAQADRAPSAALQQREGFVVGSQVIDVPGAPRPPISHPAQIELPTGSSARVRDLDKAPGVDDGHATGSSASASSGVPARAERQGSHPSDDTLITHVPSQSRLKRKRSNPQPAPQERAQPPSPKALPKASPFKPRALPTASPFKPRLRPCSPVPQPPAAYVYDWATFGVRSFERGCLPKAMLDSMVEVQALIAKLDDWHGATSPQDDKDLFGHGLLLLAAERGDIGVPLVSDAALSAPGFPDRNVDQILLHLYDRLPQLEAQARKTRQERGEDPTDPLGWSEGRHARSSGAAPIKRWGTNADDRRAFARTFVVALVAAR